MTDLEFAGSIVHEVNQPVAAMLTQAASALKWLAQDPPDVGEARSSVQKAVWSAQRCADMIRSLRALVVGAGGGREWLEVNALAARALDLSSEVAEFGRDRVMCDLDPEAGRIYGSQLQLEIVFLNLLSNATKAMSASAPQCALTIRTRRERGGVCVTFHDSGSGLGGLEPDDLFRPFVTTADGRLGLGLSICRHIVALHSGSIDIKNVEGGAAVEVHLPDGV